MALSKPSFLIHLKSLTKYPYFRRYPPLPPPSFLSIRLLSFATPEEAAAERRKRKRRLRIEPPLSNLRHQQQQQQQTPSPPRPSSPPQNPNSPKLPEPVSSLSGNRLNLHNKILKLIRENDLDEAALYTRHSVYSNCRPTIYTCNAVMTAQLRQAKYSDLLSLHRFITQAGIAANIVTHNLLLSAYMDCRKTDLAMEHYKQLINDAPINPSPTTYRILVKGLVDNGKVERGLELKDEMLEKGIGADPVVYSYLMTGQAKNGNGDGVFELYEELKEKLGGVVYDGVVYGGLMKGYFLRGMEKEAMECYEGAVGDDSKVKMSEIGFNSILDVLSENGKFDEALKLFGRMLREHDPPRKLTLNLGSYNVVVDGYCADGRFNEAVEVFKSMGEKRCRPDTLSYNNLIEQLCKNDLLVVAEELYKDMGEKGVSPDEYTFGMLMGTCFQENRPDDAAAYFKAMVEAKLRPHLEVYNRLIDGLVKVGKVDEAKSFFDMMVSKLRMNDGSYQNIMNALFDVGKHDEVLGIISRMLREDPSDFTDELQEFVREGLRKEGKEEEVTKLIEELEREKAEAAAKEREVADKAKESARLAVASLIPSKLFGNKESEEGTTTTSETTEEAAPTAVSGELQTGQDEVVAEAITYSTSADEGESSMSAGESSEGDEAVAVEAKSDGDIQQVSA